MVERSRLAANLNKHQAINNPPRNFGPPFGLPDSAPLNEPLQVKVRDTMGDYLLPFPCLKTDRGWFNAELGTALGKGIEVIGWRRRDFAR